MFHRVSNGRMRGEYKVSLDEKSVSMIQVGGRRSSSNNESENRSQQCLSIFYSSCISPFRSINTWQSWLNKAKRSVTINATSSAAHYIVFLKKINR